ncbi:MAG TPA: hypothetical protein VMU05_10295 [Dongiaceae bacterium]|nr:hypothetical protein [Dongiaceae bacterium]
MKTEFTTEAPSHGTDRKWSVWVTGSFVLQGLWAFALLSLVTYLVVLSTKPGKSAVGLRVAALIFLVPGLLAGIGCYGLLKRKVWGWWVACICDWGVAAMFVYGVIDDGWSMIDWSLVGAAVCSLILPVWLVMPGTRNSYWNRNVART